MDPFFCRNENGDGFLYLNGTKPLNMKQFPAFLLLSILFISCGPGKAYPEKVKANFINSCAAKANGNTALCECLFEKVREQYTYAEFLDLENNMKKGIQSQPFLNYIDSASRGCVAENGKKP